MLYKPTTISPHREIVDPTNQDGIPFQCDVMGNSDIAKIRLMISDGTYEYYFDGQNIQSKINFNDYGAKINCIYNNSKVSHIIKINDSTRWDSNMKDLNITTSHTYAWQMRLYEDATKPLYAPSSWIGWGAVGDMVGTYYATDNYSNYSKKSSFDYYTEKVKVIKIRPHTNMYFQNSVSSQFCNLYSRYDDNAKYYIKINGQCCEIKDYKFYNPINKFNESNDLDSYDNPIYGYAVLDYNDAPNISENDEYTIYCNYIDTDIYYFDTSVPPSLKLFECFDNNGNQIQREITNDGIRVNYSNLHIRGSYTQTGGASIEHYNFTLEECVDMSANKYVTIHTTGDIYSSLIEYKYDRFISGSKYRLTLTLKDTFGVVTEKQLNIYAEYSSPSYPIQLTVEEYNKNNSVIVDFSQVVSITGDEKIQGAHEFIAIDEESGYKDEHFRYGENACHLNAGNSITFDSVDGVGDLSFSDSTYYLICNVDSNYTGKIFEIYDNQMVISRLSWDGVQFIAEFIEDSSDTVKWRYFSPYQSWFDAHPTKESKINGSNGILEAMAQTNPNYTVPFLYYEDLPYNDLGYYHEETAASGQTWAIIMDYGKQQMLCKNIFNDNDGWHMGKDGCGIQWR